MKNNIIFNDYQLVRLFSISYENSKNLYPLGNVIGSLVQLSGRLLVGQHAQNLAVQMEFSKENTFVSHIILKKNFTIVE